MERSIWVLGVAALFFLLLLQGCPPLSPVLHLLDVSAQGQGGVAKVPDATAYRKGTSVSLTATPEAGWRFDRWTGDVESGQNPLTVTINANMTITAVFVEEIPVEPLYPSFETEVLFDGAALDLPTEAGPAANPVFALDLPAFIATVTVWQDSTLEIAPEIRLSNPGGVTLGPWPTSQVEGAPEGMIPYEAIIDAPLPPGNYAILNSEVATWLHNAASLNAGFTRIEGVLSDAESSGVIGAGGGTLTLEDVTLSLPPGAVMEDAVLQLHEVVLLFPDAISRGILVRGLPGTMLQGYSLSFPAPPGAEEGEAWFSFQVPGSDLSEGVERLGGSMVRGDIAAGVARIELPPTQEEASAKAVVDIRDLDLNFLLILDIMQIQFSRERHFALGLARADVLNFHDWPKVITLGNYLEDALAYLDETMRLPYKSRRRWPIPVRIDRNLSAEAFATRNPTADRNEDYLEFRSEDLGEDDQTKARAIHELFHLIQYDYIGGAFNSEAALGENTFFYDASSTFSEFGFVGDGFFPTQIELNGSLFPIHGAFNAEATVAVGNDQWPSKHYHGYAASLFLRYLTGDSPLTVGDIWKELGEGNSSLYDALASVTYAGDWRQRIEPFGRALYSGGLRDWSRNFLSVTPANKYLRKNHRRLVGYDNTWDVPDIGVATSSHPFHAPMPDLSARPYQIRVTGNWGIWQAPKLRVETANLQGVSLEISVFAGNDEASPIAMPNSTILGNSLPGQPLEVLLHGSTSPFTVLIVATNPTDLFFSDGSIICGFIGDCPTLDQLHAIKDGLIELSGAAEGENWGVQLLGAPAGVSSPWQWNNRAFTYQGAHTDSLGPGHTRTRTWNWSGQFSEDGCELVSFNGTETINFNHTFEGGYYERYNDRQQLSIVNLPNDGFGEWGGRYGVRGDDARSKVVSLSRAGSSSSRSEIDGTVESNWNITLSSFSNISAVEATFYNYNTK